MPRLFTGIELPAKARAEFALFRGGLPGARWIEPDDYHVTLRFIGDVGVAVANEIADELELIQRRDIEIAIQGVGVFGGAKPRAIIARVEASEALCALQADQERLMRRIGMQPEARRFTPHVTLARLRGVAAETVASYIQTCGIFRPLTFVAPRFVLYSSRGSTGGGPYVVEAEYAL